MTITNGNGCTNTQAVSVTVNALPTITTTGTMAAVCFSASAQTTTLAYSATTNSPTSYSIDWLTLTDQGKYSICFCGWWWNFNRHHNPCRDCGRHLYRYNDHNEWKWLYKDASCKRNYTRSADYYDYRDDDCRCVIAPAHKQLHSHTRRQLIHRLLIVLPGRVWQTREAPRLLLPLVVEL
jgi:hypothetical protein